MRSRGWTEKRLREALRETGHGHESVQLIGVRDADEARRLRFHGSPTILVNGIDIFPHDNGHPHLECRVYKTPQGPAGVPSTSQLATALMIHL